MVGSAGLSTPTHAEDDSFLISNFLDPQEPAVLSDPTQGWILLILYLIKYNIAINCIHLTCTLAT